MHDLYSILGVSEDDVDVYIRYGITYILREGILDLSEAWVHRPNHRAIQGLHPSERRTLAAHCC